MNISLARVRLFLLKIVPYFFYLTNPPFARISGAGALLRIRRLADFTAPYGEGAERCLQTQKFSLNATLTPRGALGFWRLVNLQKTKTARTARIARLVRAGASLSSGASFISGVRALGGISMFLTGRAPSPYRWNPYGANTAFRYF